MGVLGTVVLGVLGTVVLGVLGTVVLGVLEIQQCRLKYSGQEWVVVK
jgi:hypothetical protein